MNQLGSELNLGLRLFDEWGSPHSRGITSSRKIEKACRENVVFMALSADSQPHFTTIADFISSMHRPVGELFLQILMVCDQLDWAL